MKKENGITLVALVVTIIVLLILAGVSLSMVFNSDGLFNRAQNTAKKWNEATSNESNYLQGVTGTFDSYYNSYGGDASVFNTTT